MLPDDDTNNNRTSQDEARGNFQFDGDGSFTLNIKSMGTRDENVHYVEVIFTELRQEMQPCIDESILGTYAIERC